MRYLSMLLLAVVAGCARPTFTNLGNGVAVPVESIENYATEHGVSHAAAAAQLRIESDDRRIKEHTAKYGITVEEAKRRTEHAATREPDS